VRLLDAEELAPGAAGLVQFRLSSPVVTVRGDRYILRYPSPSRTIGGGAILNAHPARRHRRHAPEVLATLKALETGDPEDLLLHLLGPHEVMRTGDLLAQSDLDAGSARGALGSLVASGRVVALTADGAAAGAIGRPDVGLVSRPAWNALVARTAELLGAYHQRYPLRLGMPREELKSRLDLDAANLNGLVARAEAEGLLRSGSTWVALPTHHVTLTADQQERVERLLAEFRARPYAPPSVAESEAVVGGDVLDYLLDAGVLVKLTDEVLFEAQTRGEMERRVVALAQERGEITVAEVRDLFGTSRRYALALLEDLDRRRVTRRVGDARVAR